MPHVEQVSSSVMGTLVHQLWEQPRQALALRVSSLSGDDLRTAIAAEATLLACFTSVCGPGAVDDSIIGTPEWKQAKDAYSALNELLDFEGLGLGQRVL